MKIITTKGRARQKTLALAKIAGVEVKAIVFTKTELEVALGYSPGKRYGTRWDKALGRCWPASKVIWLKLPVSIETIAHEVMHLKTRTNHNQTSFKNATIALARGLEPIRKPKWYEVKVVSTTITKIFELTASGAKKRWRAGERVSQQQTITAKAIH